MWSGRHGGDRGVGTLSILAPVLLACGPAAWIVCFTASAEKARVLIYNFVIYDMYFGPLTLQVKMWVQLLIPRIEDGNNFGVSIQVTCSYHKLRERFRRLPSFPLALSVFPFPSVHSLGDVEVT